MTEVYNGECGSQKTTKKIYPLIRRNILAEKPTLVVLASKDLQNKYKKQFGNYGHVINDSTTAHVVQDIITAMSNRTKLIFITHEAFKRLPVDKYTKEKYNLIIDEAFNPYHHMKNNMTTKKGVSLIQWDLFLNYKGSYKNNEDMWNKIDDFVDITIDSDGYGYHDMLDSKKFNVLTHTNTKLIMRLSEFNRLINNKGDYINMFAELEPVVLKDWCDITIACAKIEKSFLGMWLKHNKFELDIKQEFCTHKKNKLVVHVPQVTKKKCLSWSGRTRKNYPLILKEWHEYIEDKKKGEKIIVVRNNDEKRTLSNEIRIKHNAHGLDLPELIDTHAISYESSIMPSNAFRAFFREYVGLCDDNIRSGFSTYNVYQLVMRSALRDYLNTDEVHLFLLDENTALDMNEYFEFNGGDVHEVHLGAIDEMLIDKVNAKERRRQIGAIKKASKPKPMSSAERVRKHRANKKQNDITS